MDQLPRLGKRELICLLSFTCNYVVFVWRGFLFLWVLGMGYVILLWHSLSLPYNYFGAITFFNVRHQSLEESVSVLSLSAILSLSACFDSLIKFITLFLRYRNLTQLLCKLVRLAFYMLSCASLLIVLFQDLSMQVRLA